MFAMDTRIRSFVYVTVFAKSCNKLSFLQRENALSNDVAGQSLGYDYRPPRPFPIVPNSKKSHGYSDRMNRIDQIIFILFIP